MKLANYRPAKNLVLLEEVRTRESKSGNIILSRDTSAGYYKVIKIGPLCTETKVGEYVVSTLQMGVEISFEGETLMQLPEPGIDGYYSPTEEELKNPVPVFKDSPEEEEEELNIIDSENGDNDLGSELGLREED